MQREREREKNEKKEEKENMRKILNKNINTDKDKDYTPKHQRAVLLGYEGHNYKLSFPDSQKNGFCFHRTIVRKGTGLRNS